MKTLSQYPGLIGEVLRRAEERDEKRRARRIFWRRVFGLRVPKTHVVKFSETEVVFSER